MQRRYRLKSSSDFKRVLLRGHSISHPLFVLVYQSNRRNHSRIGFAAGRSIGNAILRNRAKRRMRATMKMIVPKLKIGWDIVLIARKPLLDANFKDIMSSVHSILLKSQLVNENNVD